MPTEIFHAIMHHMREKFNLTPDCEITIEANPATLDDARLREFISGGVNRISIGVQSLDDDKLHWMGRRHNADDARELIYSAKKSGIRVSADFIYGLPGENAQYIARLCHQINNLGLSHCSMYELTIDPDTPFGKMNLQMPTNEEMAEMYETIANTLALPRYEVSNYSVPGNECRHNQNIWDGAPYIGIGRGAAGRVYVENTWYEQMGDGARYEPMDDRTRATEKIIMGMRTIRGVKLTPDVLAIIKPDFISTHPELIHSHNDARIYATEKGMLILDDLLVNLIR